MKKESATIVAVAAGYEQQVSHFVEQLTNTVEEPSRNFSSVVVIGKRIYHISSEEISLGKAERLIKTKKMRKLSNFL